MKATLLTFFLLLSLWYVNGQNDSNANPSINSKNKNEVVTDSHALIFPLKRAALDSSKTIVDTKNIKSKRDSPVKEESLTIGKVGDTLFAESKNNVNNGKGEQIKSIETRIPEIISINKIFWAIVLLLIAYFIIKLLIIIINRVSEQTTSYRFRLKGLPPLIRVIGWTIAIIIIIRGVFNPPMATLIAIIASAGIVIGFAAQDILKNFFGGIIILLDRPFQIGDKIQVGEHYGEVKEIGMRSTSIVTKDDSTISIPNGEIINSAVSNSNSGELNCQVVAEIYLPIDIDTNLARQIAIEAAQVSRYIYLNKTIAVRFSNEVKKGRSFIKMRLKAYVLDVRYEFAFQSDMTEIVLQEFLLQGLIKKEELM